MSEEEGGRLRAAPDESDADAAREHQRRVKEITRSIHRGVIRYAFLAVDLSAATRSRESTLRPTLRHGMEHAAAHFVAEFFSQNPISNLGVIAMRKGTAEKLTELSGGPDKHAGALARAAAQGDAASDGAMSLKAALDLARLSLKLVPTYASREVIVVYAALSSVDDMRHGDIFDSLAALKAAGVRVSFVSVTAEIHVARRIAKETDGTFGVASSKAHLRELLLAHTAPPPKDASATTADGRIVSKLVRIGFPVLLRGLEKGGRLCACHAAWKTEGYQCPRCSSLVCDVPMVCRAWLALRCAARGCC